MDSIYSKNSLFFKYIINKAAEDMNYLFYTVIKLPDIYKNILSYDTYKSLIFLKLIMLYIFVSALYCFAF